MHELTGFTKKQVNKEQIYYNQQLFFIEICPYNKQLTVYDQSKKKYVSSKETIFKIALQTKNTICENKALLLHVEVQHNSKTKKKMIFEIIHSPYPHYICFVHLDACPISELSLQCKIYTKGEWFYIRMRELWNSENSYFYWIVEEVLNDIISYFMQVLE
jgi:hypothetical protein